MEAKSITAIVIDKVVGLLVDETKSFQGVLDPEDVEGLELELKAIQTVIKDMEAWGNEISKAWLISVADVALRLEFIMDTYLLHMERYKKSENLYRDPIPGRSIVSKVQNIRVELRRIKHEGEIIGGQSWRNRSIRTTDANWFTDTSSVIKECDAEKEKLKTVLAGGASTRLVVSLVGCGGVGKTTLVSSVYESEVMRQRFDCCAWITVSQSYNLKELLRELTTLVFSNAGDRIGDTMQLQELSTRLQRYLFMKRYLIVFDYVWKTDFWEDMNHVFPNNNRGSRIIITTRNNSIADSCDIVQNLCPFSEERSWELFCQRAFRVEFEGKCPPYLEKLSLEFVRRNHGMPLLIRAVAECMSTQKKALAKWRELLQHCNDEFEETPFFTRIASVVLSCSYDDLPVHIRLCLSYFGIFSKDYLVSDLKLYELWIAEGFVKEEMGRTLEQVAATYLNELINKNLVQVSYIDYYGIERMCRVHALMHDIILSRAEELEICHILKEKSSKRNCRRLSIYGDTKHILKTIRHSKVCSVFLFNVNETMSKSSLINLFERFKLLELLDLENAAIDYLPNKVGNLFHLKYLSIRNTKVNKLPKSIGLLLNIQTLDVRNTLMHELPIQILKLRKLRHLLASAHTNKVNTVDSIHGVRIKEGIGYLENLQTLVTMQAHNSGLSVIKELENLNQLTRLSISKLTAVIVNALSTSIQKMNHLESLSLYSSIGETFDLESISSPPPSLRRLILTCRLEKLPDWVSRLQNLTVLGLSFSSLAVEPLKALKYLPSLASLWLHRAYIGEQLHFEEDSFQKLKQLVLTELHDFRIMRIEKGALPLLEELRIGPTSDEFSSDIQHLRNLQVLEYYDMPDEFVLRLQPGGSDYWKVEFVPSVLFLYRIRGRRFVSYKLGEPGLFAHVKGFFRTTNFEWHERPLSFFYKDDEELAETSSARWSERSFFSDDIKD